MDEGKVHAMKRKYWLIVLVVLWVAVLVDIVATVVGLLRQQDFDWSSFVSLGVVVVVALVITLAWWMLKAD